MCTIASMPRLPEHCIEYVRILQWPKDGPFGGLLTYFYNFKDFMMLWKWLSWYKRFHPWLCSKLDTSLDGDNPEHIQWVFERSQERAAEFSITGVTYRLTQGEDGKYNTLNPTVLICRITSAYFWRSWWN